MFMFPIHASMLHIYAACPYCMYMLNVYDASISSTVILKLLKFSSSHYRNVHKRSLKPVFLSCFKQEEKASPECRICIAGHKWTNRRLCILI
jgi:hypothetical protein